MKNTNLKKCLLFSVFAFSLIFTGTLFAAEQSAGDKISTDKVAADKVAADKGAAIIGKSAIERLFYTAVRIEKTSVAGEKETGTSFAVRYDYGDNKYVIFLVTAKNFLVNADKVTFYFKKSDGKKPLLGEDLAIEIDQPGKLFLYPADKSLDFAVIPLEQIFKTAFDNKILTSKPSIFLIPIDKTMIATPDQLGALSYIEDVVFIGYPTGVYDLKNLLPLARKEMTASPIDINYKGKPVFLINAGVLPFLRWQKKISGGWPL